jgi:predicted RNase H-like nuclease (RuvC/YqgF family)
MWEFVAKYWLEILFGLIVTGLTTGVTRINKKLKEEKTRNQAIENGVRDILRMQMLDTYERCKVAGTITVSRKDAIDSAYKSYHALGGNGTITQVHNELMGMPIV